VNQQQPSLYQAARTCLLSRELEEKLQLTDSVAQAWAAGELALTGWSEAEILEAGRPAKPELVPPAQLPRRGLGSERGRLALIHAIAHIEFNAINLAWDAVQRFPGMPREYYTDWVQVAKEEAHHFRLLRDRLLDGGIDYGEFEAHDGLWQMARRTAHDPLIRMALVPRMLEARGLDVTPGIMERFHKLGDQLTVAALEIIQQEEVGHVTFGDRWFRYLCQQRGVEPEETYFSLLSDFLNGEIRCPLHREARLQAGFTPGELDRLEALCEKN
jgi:uncharacterized ferritin-like protein (DUF455 family)